AGPGNFSIVVDPAGQFAYVANSDSNTISGYTIDPSTGSLSPISGSPFLADTLPSSLQIHPTGRFLFAVNSTVDSTGSEAAHLSGFSVDIARGALNPLPISFFPDALKPAHHAALAVDPTGRFAYLTNSTSNTVSAYRITSDGGFTVLLDPPVPTAFNPVFVTIDPADQFLYVVDDAAQCSD